MLNNDYLIKYINFTSSIQTVTVGFGISPNQPQAQDLRVVGCTTGGDFHPALKIMFNC